MKCPQQGLCFRRVLLALLAPQDKCNLIHYIWEKKGRNLQNCASHTKTSRWINGSASQRKIFLNLGWTVLLIGYDGVKLSVWVNTFFVVEYSLLSLVVFTLINFGGLTVGVLKAVPTDAPPTGAEQKDHTGEEGLCSLSRQCLIYSI